MWVLRLENVSNGIERLPFIFCGNKKHTKLFLDNEEKWTEKKRKAIGLHADHYGLLQVKDVQLAPVLNLYIYSIWNIYLLYMYNICMISYNIWKRNLRYHKMIF